MDAQMVAYDEASAAGHVLRVALQHSECVGGEVLEREHDRERVRLDMNVEMPLDAKADGVSSSGVRTCEPVVLKLPANWPWQSPRFYLREDFPRNFPHLMPFSTPPRPCLIDGDQDEFFLQFGLVDYGVFHLVDQLAVWLRKAAINGLIDPDQGWEPMLRHGYRDIVEFDAERARSLVDQKGGWTVWKAKYYRRGDPSGRLGLDAEAWLTSDGERTPLKKSEGDDTFSASPMLGGIRTGNTVVAIIWPDKNPDGSARVHSNYMPEDVETLGQLRARAEEVGCARGLNAFLSNLERSFDGFVLAAPIPIAVILCIRRPVHLIGTESDIELLPYIVEIRAGSRRQSLFAQGDDEPTSPTAHYQQISAPLMRSLSGSPERSPLVMLGCGSVGSKLALHAARSGQDIMLVSDQSSLRPHNMARHALGPSHVTQNKAEALAAELAGFGLRPEKHKGDLGIDLHDPKFAKVLLPKQAGAIINSTASLSVREALVAAATSHHRPRLFEAALFGRGRGAYLLADGPRHNPNHTDLMAEMYATIGDTRAGKLLFDPDEGLAEIRIGQGCGSLTMQISDARLSAMTASLALEIDDLLTVPNTHGIIVTGAMGDGTPDTSWARQRVPPFETVAIAGTDGWELRISKRVANRIRAEAESHLKVETGGVMIGCTSARLKVVTVVDLLEAPPDSQRSSDLFVLGTQGLHAAIEARHELSGRTLFDVGTWHSHLQDDGPSGTDWNTAAELAAERTPPSILLIVTPRRFHALMHTKEPD
ncbi:Mov34/MPN/PAD-1 family protein [Pacificispira sp.]|uniref:Mov34/MPN/PAD-1 family protein n=1 Tax=Pacificispira sp. TaxID=2888761 RepID=UPI003BAD642D